MISVLIAVIVAALAAWIVEQFVSDSRIKMLLHVIIVVAVVIILIMALSSYTGFDLRLGTD